MTTLGGAYPLVSFVISTHNRRNVLLRTLEQIEQCGLGKSGFEVLVVDNASPDGTAEAIAQQFPTTRVFALLSNRGSCAKNIAIGHARGQYIVFLDDDSHPMPGAIVRMIEHFEQDPQLGAAVFTITLPDGSRECSAYPDVFIGCGTGFRAEALSGVGGLPEDFFMQAEEYDLSLRLLQAGWDIRAFDDLHVHHLKTPGARRSWRTMRLDVRNNFLVATKYLPGGWVRPFTLDWMQRYYRIAAAKGQRSAFLVGLIQGTIHMIRPDHRRPVSSDVFERFTKMRQIEQRLRQVKEEFSLQSILLIDYGKNILPYWLAAKKLGLRVVAIADNRLAGMGKYRGAPVLNDVAARQLHFDAAIISNSSPVHAQTRTRIWRQLDSRPVIDLLESQATYRATSSAQQRTGLAA